jgi:5'-3' exonuclease
MCVLLGTDYNLSIPNFGEKAILHYIQNYTIEKIMEMIKTCGLKKISRNKITKGVIVSGQKEYEDLNI